MVHWKLVYALAALHARRLVQARPIEEDKSDAPSQYVVMDASFPGLGVYLPSDARPTSATTFTGEGSLVIQEEVPQLYDVDQLHAPVIARRRLEVTKSPDMKKLEMFFGMDLETDITKLPTKAETKSIPWPSSYWPAYADSINYRWNKSQPSPSEKYAIAFGHDPKKLMDQISALNGIDKHKRRKVCTHKKECKMLNDTSLCAKRENRTEGHCIPKWYGLCHAWAPASILEPEPSCPVVVNGTRFEPYDIKALITLAYHDSKIPVVFTGSRYKGFDIVPNVTDQYGRFNDARRRDISPGFFHIAATNIIGRFNSTFVIDITAGREVWNQPVRGYEIVRLAWTTPTAAAKRYFNVSRYPFNDAATKIAVVTTRLYWVVESGENGPLVSTRRVNKYTTKVDYDYVLETDETYQILGGEWLSGSKANHIDFLWIPASKPDLSTVTALGMVYSEIEQLVLDSARDDCSLPPTNNSTAKHVPEGSNASTESSGSAPDDSVDESESPGSAPDGSEDHTETPGSTSGGPSNSTTAHNDSDESSKSDSDDSPELASDGESKSDSDESSKSAYDESSGPAPAGDATEAVPAGLGAVHAANTENAVPTGLVATRGGRATETGSGGSPSAPIAPLPSSEPED